MDNQQQQRINRAAQEFTDALVAAYKTTSDSTVVAQQLGAKQIEYFFDTVINNYAQQIGFIGGRSETLIGLIFLIIVLVSPNGLIGLWERALAGRRRGGPETTSDERGSAEQLTPAG